LCPHQFTSSAWDTEPTRSWDKHIRKKLNKLVPNGIAERIQK
jgi:hypothetical protein